MGQYLTPNQKSIVNRFYANADARLGAALQELVSDLALAEPGKATDKLWQKADDLLTKCGVPRAEIERCAGKRDLKAFAEIVAKLVSRPGDLGARKPPPASERR